MVIVIIEGGNRDMGTTYTLLNEVIIPNFQRDRILVAINQADFTMKGHHWNYYINKLEYRTSTFFEKSSFIYTTKS